MDIIDGKVFHKELPEMLLKKLKSLSFLERKKLLEELENPQEKAGVLIKEYGIYYEAI